MFPKSWISFMIFLWWLKALAQTVEGAEVNWTQSCFSPQLLHVGKWVAPAQTWSFLQLPHHFLPLPTAQAKAWPSEEDGEDTPTRSIPNSLRGPLPAFLVCCWLCSLEEGLNHDSSLSRSHSILRSRVPNPWYPFLFPFLGPSQSFWAAPSHSSLASFCLFPGTWSISTPSFSLSRQNFIHIW